MSKSPVTFGFQSGENAGSDADDSYAGSMYYDKVRRQIFLTGGTYSTSFDVGGANTHSDYSDCFIASLKLPEGTNKIPENWTYSRILGKSNVNDVCSDIEVYNPDPNNNDGNGYELSALFTIGHADPNGLLSELAETELVDPKIFGFSMLMDLNTNVEADNHAKLFGGGVFQNEKVQYPVAITQNLMRRNMYVAMLSSDFDNQNNLDNTGSSSPHNHYDFTAGSGYQNPVRGKDFSVSIKMLSLKNADEVANEPERGGLKEAFNTRWSREYEPINDSNPRVADIMYLPSTLSGGFLIFAGSTSGYGIAFGQKTAPNPLPTTPDIDGYVTKLHASSGNLADDIAQAYSVRIQSQSANGASSSGEKDEVKGLCSYVNPPTVVNPTHFYVVGSTTGILENGHVQPVQAEAAFIMKLATDSMEQVWVKQISTVGTGGVVGLSCAVTPDGDDVYLAGTVSNGDHVDAPFINASAGGSDIFLAKYKTSNGEMGFIKQSGSKKDDWLATGQGVSVDDDGNAILLASTRGNFYRWRSVAETTGANKDASDIVVMSVSRSDGSWMIPHDFLPYPAGTPTSPPPLNSSSSTGIHPIGVFFIILSIFFGLLLLMMGAFYVTKRSYIEDDDDWDGKHDDVMRYLEDFDDSKVELHIRHSATGGIHGIYDLDKRGHEYVHNNDEVTVHLTSAADHIDVDTDSVIKDALFLDLDDNKDSHEENIKKSLSTHTIGSDDENEVYGSQRDRRRSYLGLVDSYNESWNERSAHSISNSRSKELQNPSRVSNSEGLSQLADKEFRDYDSDEDNSPNTWGKEIV